MSRRLYEDEAEEMASIIAWLERRMEWASEETLPLYVASFKKMWCESFDTLDNVPPEFKEKVMTRYRELKEAET